MSDSSSPPAQTPVDHAGLPVKTPVEARSREIGDMNTPSDESRQLTDKVTPETKPLSETEPLKRKLSFDKDTPQPPLLHSDNSSQPSSPTEALPAESDNGNSNDHANATRAAAIPAHVTASPNDNSSAPTTDAEDGSHNGTPKRAGSKGKRRSTSRPKQAMTERQLLRMLKQKNRREAMLSNVYKRNPQGETPLHVACIEGDLDLTKDLLAAEAPINATDNAGWTPLHEACNHGHLEIAHVLLEAGAKVDVKGMGDDTPLHDAAMNGHDDVIELLFKFNANPSPINKQGLTPLDVACDDETGELLANHGSIRCQLKTRRKKRKPKQKPEPKKAPQSTADDADNSDKHADNSEKHADNSDKHAAKPKPAPSAPTAKRAKAASVREPGRTKGSTQPSQAGQMSSGSKRRFEGDKGSVSKTQQSSSPQETAAPIQLKPVVPRERAQPSLGLAKALGGKSLGLNTKRVAVRSKRPSPLQPNQPPAVVVNRTNNPMITPPSSGIFPSPVPPKIVKTMPDGPKPYPHTSYSAADIITTNVTNTTPAATQGSVITTTAATSSTGKPVMDNTAFAVVKAASGPRDPRRQRSTALSTPSPTTTPNSSVSFDLPVTTASGNLIEPSMHASTSHKDATPLSSALQPQPLRPSPSATSSSTPPPSTLTTTSETTPMDIADDVLTAAANGHFAPRQRDVSPLAGPACNVSSVFKRPTIDVYVRRADLDPDERCLQAWAPLLQRVEPGDDGLTDEHVRLLKQQRGERRTFLERACMQVEHLRRAFYRDERRLQQLYHAYLNDEVTNEYLQGEMDFFVFKRSFNKERLGAVSWPSSQAKLLAHYQEELEFLHRHFIQEAEGLYQMQCLEWPEDMTQHVIRVSVPKLQLTLSPEAP